MDDAPSAILADLRWKPDRIVTNPEGKRVWLKACPVPQDPAAVTDCCSAEHPCGYHRRLTHQSSAKSQ